MNHEIALHRPLQAFQTNIFFWQGPETLHLGLFLQINVPVKLKLKHPPPRAYPGHLMSFPVREGGNLINLVFPGAGI